MYCYFTVSSDEITPGIAPWVDSESYGIKRIESLWTEIAGPLNTICFSIFKFFCYPASNNFWNCSKGLFLSVLCLLLNLLFSQLFSRNFKNVLLSSPSKKLCENPLISRLEALVPVCIVRENSNKILNACSKNLSGRYQGFQPRN